jgi:hypothetical protein
MGFDFLIYDTDTGVTRRLAERVDARTVELLEQATVEVLAASGSNRSQEVLVQDIYEPALYEEMRRRDEPPVAQGHVFLSAAQASRHLGRPTRAVAMSLRYAKAKTEPPDAPATTTAWAPGVAYPHGTALVNGLALVWVEDCRD